MAGPPSASNRPRISIQMCDEDIVTRVARLFGIGYVQAPRIRKKHWKQSYQVMVTGARAVALMKRLKPYLGARRQGQVERALANYVPRRTGDNCRKLTVAAVRAIRGELASDPVASLARRFSVARITIRDVKNLRTWKTV